MTGCGASLVGRPRSPGCPRTSSSSPARSSKPSRRVAGDVGAIGCVQADARLDRVRAFVKIQDGCSFSCAFCVIPLVRGATRSRSADAVLGEIRRRVAQGHREIVLTGINLGCFRDRDAGHTLAALIRAAGAIEGVERLRLSSIEVNHVDDELVAALRETPVVGPHLHVPLQSGDDGVLRAMARRYSVETYLRKLEPLGGLQPDRRRDRRLPRRGRARLRAHARDRARGAADEGARLPVLAATRDRARRPRTRCRREVKKERSARLRALSRRGLPRPLGGEGRPRRRRARRPARPRLRRRLLALARRRPARRARAGHAGAAVTEEGILAAALTTASSARSSATATTSRSATASSRSGTSTRRRRRTCSSSRSGTSTRSATSPSSRPTRRSGCSTSSREVARERRARGLPRARQRRSRRRPDHLPPTLARPGREDPRDAWHEP